MKIGDLNVPFIYTSIAGFFIFGFALGATLTSNENTIIFTISLQQWKDSASLFIAAIATFIAFSSSIRQNSITIQLKKDEIERELRACRATLPLILHNVCKYSEECLDALRRGLDDEAERIDPPIIDSESIKSIERNIKYADKSTHRSLSILVDKIQIQSARLDRELSKSINLDLHYAEHIYDALKIYVTASNLFDYARDETTSSITMHSAFSIKRSSICRKYQDEIRNLIAMRDGDDET